ncbi:MAG: hypothetical protein KJ893_08605 [Candidatus Omnitrophica bacterium]|nr:hypothetical protein [Candidatus Omnitrophota bacterium]MBU4478653.1 hypothetical protein [Candidatus Omnitrophota bacterium]
MSKLGKCPVCSEDVEIDTDAEIGEIASCPECEAELEIISLKPVKFEALEDLLDTDEEEELEDDDDSGSGNNGW